MSATPDKVLVDDIIAELGALREPHCDDRTPLATHVAQSIARVRQLQDYLQHPDKLEAMLKEKGIDLGTSADFGKAARLLRGGAVALRKIAFTDEQRSIMPELEHIVRQLDHVRQTPPPRADHLKYHCANDAFALMTFSAKPPTGYEYGPFRMIAALLYEAATGKPEVNMKNACDFVLDQRKQYDPNAFLR